MPTPTYHSLLYILTNFLIFCNVHVCTWYLVLFYHERYMYM